MTTVYYTADSVGAGVRALVTGGDNLVIASGVVVRSSNNYAVGIAGTDNGVDIHGFVHGEEGGLAFLAVTGADVNIWESGTVGSSGEDSYGIAVVGSSARIGNFGLVYGDTAIKLTNSVDCEMVNKGEIRGQSVAIDLPAGASGGFNLINTGTISAALMSSTAYRSAGDVEDVILNRGKINGPIDLGSGDDRYMGFDAKAMDEGYYAFVMGSKVGAVVSGGAGRDLLDGGRYIDFLLGDGGGDMIMGAGGNDQLAGGVGKDLLWGGTGGDFFIYGAPGESYQGHRDMIADFRHAQSDEIWLNAIDADVTRAGNQDFNFIGHDQFGDAGEVRFGYAGANTLVQANLDGDRQPEMEILLRGHVSLVAGDFSL